MVLVLVVVVCEELVDTPRHMDTCRLYRARRLEWAYVDRASVGNSYGSGWGTVCSWRVRAWDGVDLHTLFLCHSFLSFLCTYHDSVCADAGGHWLNWSINASRWAHVSGLLHHAGNSRSACRDIYIWAGHSRRCVDGCCVSTIGVGTRSERCRGMRNDRDGVVDLDSDCWLRVGPWGRVRLDHGCWDGICWGGGCIDGWCGHCE
jgi:hypothetical protein